MHTSRVFVCLAALCLVGTCAVALGARKPWSPDQKPASAPEVVQSDGRLNDRRFAVSVTLPAGWLINDAQRAPNQGTMISLQISGGTKADANFYYRIYQTPTAIPADAEAFLRSEAAKKETDRARLWAEYTRHKERLAATVGAAIGQTTGEDVDAGDVHEEKPETGNLKPETWGS